LSGTYTPMVIGFLKYRISLDIGGGAIGVLGYPVPGLEGYKGDFLTNPVVQRENAVLVVGEIVVAWQCSTGHV
jgi:hypothetical protein